MNKEIIFKLAFPISIGLLAVSLITYSNSLVQVEKVKQESKIKARAMEYRHQKQMGQIEEDRNNRNLFITGGW